MPVYRVVHEAGSFVITMPNAYHAGFNTGFNVAEVRVRMAGVCVCVWVQVGEGAVGGWSAGRTTHALPRPEQAVNFAPPNWLPYGSDVAQKYRHTKKPMTFR